MKNVTLALAACFFFTGAFSQSSAVRSFYISSREGKRVVKENETILKNPVILESHAQLLPNGTVIWGDKSRTILNDGDFIDESGIIYTRNPERDFSGDKRALNHIHMLPEAIIIGERDHSALKPDSGFIAYMKRVYNTIQENDYEISILKEKIIAAESQNSKKMVRKIKSLEKENMELKIEFDNYIHYGTGSWFTFRDEFNEELKPLMKDLAMLRNGELQ